MSKSQEERDPCVYIVDDDEGLRDSLVWLLESSGYKVCAYDSAERFLEEFDLQMRGCLVLDVRMPGMGGLELFDALRGRHCLLPVLFITGHGDVPMAVKAVKRGAMDFIEKPFGDRDMLGLIEESLAHERSDRERRAHEAQTAHRLSGLTQREREVLDLIIAGKLNKQIADVLGISIKTVEVHRARVMEKMGANSLAELVHSVIAGEAATSRA